MHPADDTANVERRELDDEPPASRGPRRPAPREDPSRHGWAVGRWVADRYFIERRLGGGATGEVYLARDRLLRKRVALKVLKRPLAENRETVHRFLREVALAHSVTHPNVVRIHDTGEAHGMPFFSMEYLQGQPLDQLCAQTDSPMTLREIRDVGRDILQGLSAAHAAGIIHRDLKPANVLLTHRGAIVMDFGVAVPDHAQPTVPIPEDATSLIKTEAGTIFGSPAYMAPELWEGSPPTVQSDLYAFGVMLYQMLAGRLPYRASNARQLLYQVRTTSPPPIRQLRRDTPWNVALVIRRCLARLPERRPASAMAVANLLAPLAGLGRRRVMVSAAVVATATALIVPQVTDRGTNDPRGLPDAVAVADLGAAIRSFDAGDYPAATRQLERLSARWPRSAAATWWHATVAHTIGDEPGRRARCVPQQWEGSRKWRAWAEAACEPTYSLPEDLRGELDRSLNAPAFLPLAISQSLIPRSDASRESWPTVKREGETVAKTLGGDEPAWTTDTALPVRWQLARAAIHVSHGHLDAARTLLDNLAARHPHTPAVIERSAWLDALAGRLDRANVRAQSIARVDPRPLVRNMLDEGRLADAWHEIERAPPPYEATLRKLWCGYAYRFELADKPSQCDELGPSLAQALWENDPRTDLRSLTPTERSIVRLQRALDRGECFGDDTHRANVRQIDAPFETYATQLEVAAALCLHEPGQRRAERARRYLDTLQQLTPVDPWVLLLSAQTDELAGASGPARATRERVASRWVHADADLPLVQRVRDRLAPAVTPTTDDRESPPPAEPSSTTDHP